MIQREVRRDLEQIRKQARAMQEFLSALCEENQVLSGCRPEEDACWGCRFRSAIRKARKVDGLAWDAVARLYYGYTGEEDEERQEEEQGMRVPESREEELQRLVIQKYARGRGSWAERKAAAIG